VDRIVIKGAKLDLRNIQLPPFDVDLALGPDGVRSARVESSDGHFTVQLTPEEQGVRVEAKGRNFTLPLSPSLEFGDIEAKGTVSGNRMRLTELDYSLYGGQGKGTATVTWGNGWATEGEFEFQRMDLEAVMKALQADIPSEGQLAAKGRFATQGASVDAILDGARVDSTFLVHKGNLSGLDLVRALQAPSRDGVTGGKTKFDEMSGNFSLSGGRYQYNGVRLQAGALNANGQCEVAPDKEVSGRAYVELRSSATAIRGNFRIGGTVKGMVLKQ
jgi:uncharacterized protein involved in outer membrane biogenesis